MIKVKRKRDGKVFDSNMSSESKLSILAIHFCTSYALVEIQDLETREKQPDIICEPIGSAPNPVDFIAARDCDEGEFV
jgi:hypothetical protein